jgi:phospholipid/cholesterol/gamma-HCH transport system permease protein
MRAIAKVGDIVWSEWDELRHAVAVIGTVLFTSVQPRHWQGAARKAFARQVLAVGIGPLWFVGGVAVFVGFSVVVQLTFWAGQTGQSQLLGPLLVTVVARELGPVLVSLIVIVRSGGVMTTELGILKIQGEIPGSEARGGDPFLHLVMPRVLAVTASTFGLTIMFILVTLASGFVFAAWTGQGSHDWLLFADTVSRAVHSTDVLNIVAKTTLPALFASASCCIGGLEVESVSEIPQATERALTRSIAGLFVIAAVASLLTYM